MSYQCPVCNEQRPEQEFTVPKPCEHPLYQYCMNELVNQFRRANPNQMIVITCPQCGQQLQREQETDLSFLPDFIVSTTDPTPRKPVSEQKYNWIIWNDNNKADVLKSFYIFLNQHAEEKFIKEALIFLYNINSLGILIKLKRKQRQEAMQRIILQGVHITSLDGQIDFGMYRYELIAQNVIYIKHIQNKTGNVDFYEDFRRVIQDMRAKGLL